MSALYRELKLVYRVPRDVDFEELEERMIDQLAALVGCTCNGEADTPCDALWDVTGGTVDDMWSELP